MEQSYKKEDVLVLLSGGQDSTTALFWAVKNFNKVNAVSFDYNQKHKQELQIARKICKKLEIPHKIINLSFLKDIVESNLFSGKGNINDGHKLKNDVPSSFVPYRNMIFLTIAAAWASTINAVNIVIGVCQTDYSGYADCRDDFIKSLQVSLNLATDFEKKTVIHTPIMWLTKAETFKLAEDLNCLDFIINESLTCYNGSELKNDFGKGCGECPSCKLRKKGFNEYLRKYK